MSTLIFHLWHLSRYSHTSKPWIHQKPLDSMDLNLAQNFQTCNKNPSPIIEILINKRIHTGQFPNEMKCAKVFPIFKGGNLTHLIIDLYLYYQPYQKYLKDMSISVIPVSAAYRGFIYRRGGGQGGGGGYPIPTSIPFPPTSLPLSPTSLPLQPHFPPPVRFPPW